MGFTVLHRLPFVCDVGSLVVDETVVINRADGVVVYCVVDGALLVQLTLAALANVICVCTDFRA